MKKIFCLVVCMALLISYTVSCGRRKDEEEQEPQSRMYFGFFDTVSYIYSYRNDGKEIFERNCELVRATLDKYHKLFDIYYEYSGITNIKTVNDNAGIAPVTVDRELIDFLIYAVEMYELTGGKTNIAMGSVLSIWHECREDALFNPTAARIPDERELSEAAEHTDIRKLIIDEERSTVYIADKDMSLDVGAIGKGYAAERAAEALISAGVTSYALNIGRNIRLIGERPSGKGYEVGIGSPDPASGKATVYDMTLSETSVVTSGNYERFYTVGGVNYHHIIDPATNMPADFFTSVSIVTRDSGLADALSTALFCMSYEEGLALVSSLDGVDAIWLLDDGTVLKTEGV